jgi:hypothetical protein
MSSSKARRLIRRLRLRRLCNVSGLPRSMTPSRASNCRTTVKRETPRIVATWSGVRYSATDWGCGRGGVMLGNTAKSRSAVNITTVYLSGLPVFSLHRLRRGQRRMTLFFDSLGAIGVVVSMLSQNGQATAEGRTLADDVGSCLDLLATTTLCGRRRAGKLYGS